METRGIRNRNPLNIKRGPSRWKGMRDIQTDPSFVQFDCMKYGWRAAYITMRTYVRKHNVTSLRDLIYRWSSTDQNSYVNFVAYFLGVTPDSSISGFFISNAFDFFYREIFNLLYAMAIFENGNSDKDFIRDSLNEWLRNPEV